jgi:UDP-glucose 4-epimerase
VENVHYAGKRILVTGGGGFLGSHICERLIGEGSKVRILDSFASGRRSNLKCFAHNIKIFNGDIRDKSLVHRAVSGVDVVIHTAFPLEMRTQDVSPEKLRALSAGFFHILEACLQEKALLIYLSSIAVYGNGKYFPIDENHALDPETIYGAVKISEESYCRAFCKTHGLKAVILRVSDIYGPRNTRLSVPVRFLLNALAERPLTVYGRGTQSRTYTFVSDFVDAVMLVLANQGIIGETFNIAGSRCISMLELAQTVKEVTKTAAPIVFGPKEDTSERHLAIDITKGKELLHFNPRVDLAQGLEETYLWICRNPDYVQNFAHLIG